MYLPVLPKAPEDRGNITFTISSTNPPRPTVFISPLFRTEDLRPIPDRVFDTKQRRVELGDFVFGVSSGSQSIIGSGTKIFEVGQILDFTTEDLPVLPFLEVPDIIDVQQNTNVLDLDQLGLTNIEVADLTERSRSRFDLIMVEINTVKTQINDIKVNISANQRFINEVRKAKEAAQVVFEGSDTTVVTKLSTREAQLVTERDSLSSQLTLLTVDAKAKFEELLSVKEMVR